MSHSKQPHKIDELLIGAVNLHRQPDFAQWRRQHPEAIEALTALPTLMAQRRSSMIRNVRYAASAAAVATVDAMTGFRGAAAGENVGFMTSPAPPR